MKLLKMSGHDCLLYSAAMVLDTSPDTLVEEIGHDGSEVWWPSYQDPYCRRGIHIQEILDCALSRGYILYPFEALPLSAPRGGLARLVWDKERSVKRFVNHLNGREGILITPNHAVAWDGQKVYDPVGKLAALEDYRIKEAWIVFKSF